MSFAEAIRTLNQLKKRRVIRDYAVIGAVAATAYMEPVFTEDLDIIVLVDTDEEYIQTFRSVSEHAERMEGMHLVLAGIPVQMFPSTVKPLYRDALLNAQETRTGNLRLKVPKPEHLILLYLEANRPKDQLRIRTLLGKSSDTKLTELFGRFDDEKATLARRLQTIR